MEGYIGVIQMVAFTFAPRNFAFCTGALIAISQNQSLFSLVGNYYGGDGRTTFGLPDLRARAPVGSNEMGQAPGLTSFPLGTKAGVQQTTLSSGQMPRHTHAATFTPAGGGEATGKLEAYTSGASASTPSAGSYLSGDEGAIIFGNGGLGAQLVELAGLTVSGGGSGGGVVTVEDTGASQSFEIVNPMQAVNFAICTEGIYPSRQ